MERLRPKIDSLKLAERGFGLYSILSSSIPGTVTFGLFYTGYFSQEAPIKVFNYGVSGLTALVTSYFLVDGVTDIIRGTHHGAGVAIYKDIKSKLQNHRNPK